MSNHKENNNGFDDSAPLLLNSGEIEKQKESKFTFSEILVGFFAAVAAWGVVDCLVEILANGSKPVMLYIYATGFIVALFIQFLNRILHRKFDLARALNFFA